MVRRLRQQIRSHTCKPFGLWVILIALGCYLVLHGTIAHSNGDNHGDSNRDSHSDTNSNSHDNTNGNTNGDRHHDRVPFAAHPTPPGLAPWTDEQSGDYFDAVQFSSIGALTWSHWPVRVSIDPTAPPDWQADVRLALDNWQTYVPLTIVPETEAITPDQLATFETSETRDLDDLAVDIAIVRTVVRSQPDANGLLRAASARATFSLFVVRDRDEAGIVRERFGHRFVIRVSPTQTGTFVRSAVRHEFGHALGIWGHSPNPEDVMFAAQVAQPGTVSTRDVNTLKRIYAQPTRLGWWVKR